MSRPDGSERDAPTEADRRSGEDRRQQFRPRLRERRSGYDRRVGGQSAGARYNRLLARVGHDSLTFWTILATIVVFNFLDLVLTIRALDRGAEEANPVMRSLFWSHPLTAALIKLGVVAAVVLALLALRRYRDAVVVALVIFVGLTALMFYHAGFAVGWLG